MSDAIVGLPDSTEEQASYSTYDTKQPLSSQVAYVLEHLCPPFVNMLFTSAPGPTFRVSTLNHLSYFGDIPYT